MDLKQDSNIVVASSESDGAKPSPKHGPGPGRIVVLAPELFRAEGGIARISRLYLQAVADNSPDAPLSVIVLNDSVIPTTSLTRYHAGNADAVACDRSKWRCAKALWHATRTPGTYVICTHIHLAPMLWGIRLFRPALTYDIVIHGIEVWKPLSWLTRRSIASARQVLSVSDYTRRQVLDQLPQHSAKIVILPNALDPGFEFETNEKATVPHTILAVSRLAPHDHEKGIDHLITAMAQIVKQEPNAQLRIVGEGADRPRLEALAAKSPATAHITFLGFLPETELKQEFQRCALFALPSKKEGFGLVYLEAMAAGKPCIVADAGGAPEVIDSNSGLLVPYGETEKLAATVTDAIKRPWDKGKIKDRAIVFSFSAFSKKFLQQVSCKP